MDGGYFTHVFSASTVSALQVVFTQWFPAGSFEDHRELFVYSS